MASGKHIQISMQTPVEIAEKLDRIARALDRDRSWVLLRALQFYLDREGGDILIDAKGIASVDRGETVEWSEALKRINAAIARGTSPATPSDHI